MTSINRTIKRRADDDSMTENRSIMNIRYSHGEGWEVLVDSHTDTAIITVTFESNLKSVKEALSSNLLPELLKVQNIVVKVSNQVFHSLRYCCGINTILGSSSTLVSFEMDWSKFDDNSCSALEPINSLLRCLNPKQLQKLVCTGIHNSHFGSTSEKDSFVGLIRLQSCLKEFVFTSHGGICSGQDDSLLRFTSEVLEVLKGLQEPHIIKFRSVKYHKLASHEVTNKTLEIGDMLKPSLKELELFPSVLAGNALNTLLGYLPTSSLHELNISLFSGNCYNDSILKDFMTSLEKCENMTTLQIHIVFGTANFPYGFSVWTQQLASIVTKSCNTREWKKLHVDFTPKLIFEAERLMEPSYLYGWSRGFGMERVTSIDDKDKALACQAFEQVLKHNWGSFKSTFSGLPYELEYMYLSYQSVKQETLNNRKLYSVLDNSSLPQLLHILQRLNGWPKQSGSSLLVHRFHPREMQQINMIFIFFRYNLCLLF